MHQMFSQLCVCESIYYIIIIQWSVRYSYQWEVQSLRLPAYFQQWATWRQRRRGGPWVLMKLSPRSQLTSRTPAVSARRASHRGWLHCRCSRGCAAVTQGMPRDTHTLCICTMCICTMCICTMCLCTMGICIMCIYRPTMCIMYNVYMYNVYMYNV